MTESFIKRQICDYLALRRDIVADFWINASIGIRGRKNHSRHQKTGISDILGVLKGGKLLCIEVKIPGGKVSKEQAEFLSRMNAAGALAFVAFSLDDVIKELSCFAANETKA